MRGLGAKQAPYYGSRGATRALLSLWRLGPIARTMVFRYFEGPNCGDTIEFICTVVDARHRE